MPRTTYSSSVAHSCSDASTKSSTSSFAMAGRRDSALDSTDRQLTNTPCSITSSGYAAAMRRNASTPPSFTKNSGLLLIWKNSGSTVAIRTAVSAGIPSVFSAASSTDSALNLWKASQTDVPFRARLLIAPATANSSSCASGKVCVDCTVFAMMPLWMMAALQLSIADRLQISCTNSVVRSALLLKFEYTSISVRRYGADAMRFTSEEPSARKRSARRITSTIAAFFG